MSSPNLISLNLPPALKTVIPEAILIGNPDPNLVESCIPHKDTLARIPG
jgi:hypothetical protein